MFVTVYTGYVEGFLPLISTGLWIALLCSFVLSVRLALTVPTKYLLALVFVVIVLEYCKETIGVSTRMWSYNGKAGQYLFGIWLWVSASLSAFALARELLHRWQGWRRIRLPSTANALLLLFAAALVRLTLGEYAPHATVVFWGFYAVLVMTSVWASLRMPFPLLATCVVLSWLVGATSEYLGSIDSGAWTFAHSTHFPPIYLLAGCWPLEIVAQFSIAAVLVGGSLGEALYPTAGGTHE